jgi:catechol-2,3-dioxygenase
MPPNLALELAHAVVLVNDVDAMVDFYCRVLGFEVTDRGPLARLGDDQEIVFLSMSAEHHHQIAFITGADAGQAGRVNHLAFRSSGSVADLRALLSVLEATEEVTAIRPVTHGNAWSVYFSDPEGNGIEVFLDTPWHVAQPQAHSLDLGRGDEEIRQWTEETFGHEPEFGPMDEYRARRRAELGTG